MIKLLWLCIVFFTGSVFAQIADDNVEKRFASDFVMAALERTQHAVSYNGAYFSIPYPNGDVPAHLGVCTDVIVRSYRAIGADLQQLVHEDMVKHFNLYPSARLWGLKSTDKNIDHRRVPNLQTYFARHGVTLAVSSQPQDYAAGDLVTWMLPGNLPHIGIVTDKKSATTGNPLIVHNIGAGPKLDDGLFDYPITGHYRFVPKNYRGASNTAPSLNIL
jgi:hypothetical protein